MVHADIVKNRSLVNGKQQLIWINRRFQAVQTGHFVFAPFQPARRAVYRILDIRAVCTAGRAFVKRHSNGRCQVGLNLHALLRPHKNIAPVYMGTEINAFLFDFAQVCQRKHLKPAGIGQYRPLPCHKFMQSAQFFYQHIPRAHMQVVGIGQLHLRADAHQIFGGHGTFNCPAGSYVHKYRGLDIPMHRMQDAALCPAFFSD